MSKAWKQVRAERDEILAAIDHGPWKYSWHLNLNRWNDIDWDNIENLELICSVLQNQHTGAVEFAALTQRLLEIAQANLEECRQANKEQAELDAEEDPSI